MQRKLKDISTKHGPRPPVPFQWTALISAKQNISNNARSTLFLEQSFSCTQGHAGYGALCGFLLRLMFLSSFPAPPLLCSPSGGFNWIGIWKRNRTQRSSRALSRDVHVSVCAVNVFCLLGEKKKSYLYIYRCSHLLKKHKETKLLLIYVFKARWAWTIKGEACIMSLLFYNVSWENLSPCYHLKLITLWVTSCWLEQGCNKAVL